MRSARFRPGRLTTPFLLALALAACAGDSAPTGDPLSEDETQSFLDSCTIPLDLVIDGGVGRDGIPSLTNPKLVAADHPEAEYLVPDDRVIGFEVGGRAIAVPHNILWWHEVVNLNLPEIDLLVTFCPLTGSSLVFDRANAGGAEFGVSGLLFRTNLIMFDRNTEESLWPQMSRGARCGERVGLNLEMYPAIEMTWEGWRSLHPDTRVLSVQTGFSRNYTRNPYTDYLADPDPLVSLDVDPRRPTKERVFGLVLGTDGGWAFPWGELERHAVRAIELIASGGTVVFWDRELNGAAAYRATVDGRQLRFTTDGDRIVDLETRSVWRLDGRAIDGPLAGTRLTQIPEGYTAMWFAWELFQPETAIWEGNV